MGTRITEYTVENQRVTCTHEPSGHRIWHCGCADFARRAETYREGFCAHVACAIHEALLRGEIDFVPPPSD